MFDFAWTEIALIGVVALVAIGPKDMPVAIRAVTSAIKKARRMAAEFQTHVDDMVRDADLHEVRNSISEIRNFDFKGTVERAVDPDGSLRATLRTNPLAPDPVVRAPAPEEPAALAEAPVAELVRSAPTPPVTPDPAMTGSAASVASASTRAAEPAGDTEPWFIPPALAAKPEPTPWFVPPGTKRPPAG